MIPESTNPFETILTLFAERLHDAPGAAQLRRLARTARRIPESVLDDLVALVLRLDDVQLVGDDVAIHLIEVGFCDARYADAIDFVSDLRARLQRYVEEPRVANDARADFRDRVAWWKMALQRAASLCTWPAIVLTRL